MLAYVSKNPDGAYDPFVFATSLQPADVEIADDVFIIRKEDAEAYKVRLEAPPEVVSNDETTPSGAPAPAAAATGAAGLTYPTGTSVTGAQEAREKPPEIPSPDVQSGFRWSGEITPQKWMNFYTKVLARFATSGGLKLTLTVEVAPPGGVTKQRLQETKVALRELGMEERLEPIIGTEEES